MNLISRMLSGLLVLSALLVTFISLSSEWLLELDLVTDRFSGNRISLHEIERRSEQLAREAHAAIKRLCIKEKIAEALRDGEITLLDAAACFRSLHEDPKSRHHPHRSLPSIEDGEGWCREVIDWTDLYLRFNHSPGQADAMHQRLETELQEQLECHGVVTLPE